MNTTQMIPNCKLEAMGWTGIQEKGKIYLNETITKAAGDKLESAACMVCNDCMLFDDCKPRPLFEGDKFVGVRIEI